MSSNDKTKQTAKHEPAAAHPDSTVRRHVCRFVYLGVALASAAACTEQTPADDGSDDQPTADAVPYPAVCSDISRGQAMPDGEHTLYVSGDPLSPWTAYCHADKEYLTLPAQAHGQNVGLYQAGGDAVGQTVRTQYQRVRIDPTTFTVDVSDETFATTTGSLTRGGDVITSMPFGIAMACAGGAEVGEASIALSGTPFAIASTFAPGGVAADGGTTMTNGSKSLSLWATGSCGWIAPAMVQAAPQNQVQEQQGWVLRLAYAQ